MDVLVKRLSLCQDFASRGYLCIYLFMYLLTYLFTVQGHFTVVLLVQILVLHNSHKNIVKKKSTKKAHEQKQNIKQNSIFGIAIVYNGT